MIFFASFVGIFSAVFVQSDFVKLATKTRKKPSGNSLFCIEYQIKRTTELLSKLLIIQFSAFSLQLLLVRPFFVLFDKYQYIRYSSLNQILGTSDKKNKRKVDDVLLHLTSI